MIAGLAVTSLASAAGPNTLTVRVNGDGGPVESRLWSGQPYVRLRDTAAFLGWYPQWDTAHHLYDVAGCVRIEANSRRVVRIDYDPLVGKAAIALAGELDPLPVPTRLAQNDLWVPLASLARTMGYQASFRAAQKQLDLTAPKSDNDQYQPLASACQRFVRSVGARR